MYKAIYAIILTVVLAGCVQNPKGENSMPKKQYMLASYQVKLEDQSDFLKELLATERAYREEGFITDKPIIRMRSKIDPEFILEIIEWVNCQAFQDVQENDRVMSHWGKLESLWKNGGFGLDKIPESKIPWVMMDVIEP